MIIEKILKLLNQFIISLSGRLILAFLIGVSLWFLYWINIIGKDYYYPDRYEEAFGISGWLMIVIIVSATLIFFGTFINRRNNKHIK